MFAKRYGRRHVVNGAIYLIVLVTGFLDALFGFYSEYRLMIDCCLGSCGISLALTAAYDFKHKHVKNVASGTLDTHATVTYDEMIEHSFYQGLNLFQIVYLHAAQGNIDTITKAWMAGVATSPWLIRHRFPVNHFSDNYNRIDPKSNWFIRVLYRIKKYQYVFYKHFILHGLNITVAVTNSNPVRTQTFRLFWMLLNASYVMEFFLQTLVKKSYISQLQMLVLQQLLMLASSIVACYVLAYIDFRIASASLFLNFVHRGHDVTNFALVLLVAAGGKHYFITA